MVREVPLSSSSDEGRRGRSRSRAPSSHKRRPRSTSPPRERQRTRAGGNRRKRVLRGQQRCKWCYRVISIEGNAVTQHEASVYCLARRHRYYIGARQSPSPNGSLKRTKGTGPARLSQLSVKSLGARPGHPQTIADFQKSRRSEPPRRKRQPSLLRPCVKRLAGSRPGHPQTPCTPIRLSLTTK